MPEAYVDAAYIIYFEDISLERVAEILAEKANEFMGKEADYNAKEFLENVDVVVGRFVVRLEDDRVLVLFDPEDWKSTEGAYRYTLDVAEAIRNA